MRRSRWILASFLALLVGLMGCTTAPAKLVAPIPLPLPGGGLMSQPHWERVCAQAFCATFPATDEPEELARLHGSESYYLSLVATSPDGKQVCPVRDYTSNPLCAGFDGDYYGVQIKPYPGLSADEALAAWGASLTPGAFTKPRETKFLGRPALHSIVYTSDGGFGPNTAVGCPGAVYVVTINGLDRYLAPHFTQQFLDSVSITC